MDGFASARQATVTETVGTIFYNDIAVAAVIGILIRPWPFTAFQGNGIVIY